MDNLQKSEKVIAVLLANLIERGLKHGTVSMHNLGLPNGCEEFLYPSAIWLGDEGIIRFQDISSTFDGAVDLINPVLTSHGFNLMQKQLEIGGQTTSIGSAVKEVANEKRSFAQMGDFFGGVLGGFTKSIGS